MTDTRHRDVWKVWFKVDEIPTEYAHFLYAVDESDAIERGWRQLSRAMPDRGVTIISAERR